MKKLTVITILMIGTNAFAGVNYNDPNLHGNANNNLTSTPQAGFNDANMKNIGTVFTQLASAMNSVDVNDMSGFNPLSPSLGENSKPAPLLMEDGEDIER